VPDVLDAYQHERAQAQAEAWTPARLPLMQFVQDAWPIVEQGRKYDHNWHLEALCEHISAIFTGALTNLLINISPRSGKSIVLSVMFHPWAWVMNPGYRLLYFSYSMGLALRDARRARELIRSPWYQRMFGDRVQIDPAFDTIMRLRTLAGGQRFSSSVGGAATAEGGDARIIDDPHNVEEARHESRVDIEAAKDFVFNVLPSRVENFNESREIICGQRMAVDDLSSEVRANKTHTELIIPMEYVLPEDGVKPTTPLGWSDPREEPGELMWPAHMNARAAAVLKATKRLDWAAQFQQDPQSVADKLFPRGNWRYFTAWPDPGWFEMLIQSWDMRFSDNREAGSFVAGHVWGKRGPHLYLLDRFFERASFPETQTAVRAMTAREPYGPHTTGKLVENKANGPAILQSLRAEVSGLIAVDPKYFGGKWERAQAMAFLQHAGNIWLPHKALAPWVDQYVENMWRFPAPPDDDTDASSQAWRRLNPFGIAADPRRAQAQQHATLERQRQQAWRHQASQPFKLSRTGA